MPYFRTLHITHRTISYSYTHLAANCTNKNNITGKTNSAISGSGVIEWKLEAECNLFQSKWVTKGSNDGQQPIYVLSFSLELVWFPIIMKKRYFFILLSEKFHANLFWNYTSSKIVAKLYWKSHLMKKILDLRIQHNITIILFLVTLADYLTGTYLPNQQLSITFSLTSIEPYVSIWSSIIISRASSTFPAFSSLSTTRFVRRARSTST